VSRSDKPCYRNCTSNLLLDWNNYCTIKLFDFKWQRWQTRIHWLHQL